MLLTPQIKQHRITGSLKTNSMEHRPSAEAKSPSASKKNSPHFMEP